MAESETSTFVKGPFETTTLCGIQVHYRFRPAKKSKDKRTLFLWHGFLGSVFSWNRVWDLFAQNFDGNILAFDRPAFGYTERPQPVSTLSPTGVSETGATDSTQRLDPYTYDTAADLGVALLKYLDLPHAIYVGHSAGGTCTLFSFLKYPEVFQGIILIDAAIYTSGPPAFVAWLMSLSFMDSIGKWMTKKMMSATADMMANSAFYDKQIAKDPKMMEEASKPLKENPTAMDTLWLFSKRNLPENEKTKEKILAHMADYGKVPVLVISGVQDKIVPLSEAVKLARNIPGAELVQIPECGHVPIDEKPQDTVDQIMKFVYSKVYLPKTKSSKKQKKSTRQENDQDDHQETGSIPEPSNLSSTSSDDDGRKKKHKQAKQEKKKSHKKLQTAAEPENSS